MAGLSALVYTFSEFQWDHRLKERRDPSFFMERLKLLSCLLSISTCIFYYGVYDLHKYM